jgi:threonine/homoserine/homoserine lactone efflux protein
VSEPLATLGALAGVHALVAMSPGPNALIVLRNAARARRLGVASAAGIFPAAAFWASAGMLGLGALFHAFPQVEAALSFVCGAYLVWLGVKALRATFAPAAPRPEAEPAPAASSLRQAFVEGALTNLTNPKTIAYVSSVFAAVGVFDLPLGWRLVALAMMPTMSFAWYATLALAVSSGPMTALLTKGRAGLERVAGGLMILFGVKLLAQR